MINSRPSELCGMCIKGENCFCLCHTENLVYGKHFFIRKEPGELKAKQVKDLEHFRDV